MIVVKLPLPCKAIDLERALHSMCDGHGCWPTTVITENEGVLVLVHEEAKDGVATNTTP